MDFLNLRNTGKAVLRERFALPVGNQFQVDAEIDLLIKWTWLTWCACMR
jgi:hypothetical protein